MPFTQEFEATDRTEKLWGRYVVTFHSQNGQVEATLFEKRGVLVAHVTATGGRDIADVTDVYYSDLERFAEENGYSGKLRMVFH